jgi:hypothetical protein
LVVGRWLLVAGRWMLIGQIKICDFVDHRSRTAGHWFYVAINNIYKARTINPATSDQKKAPRRVLCSD